MKAIRRSIAGLLCISITLISLPNPSMCHASSLFARSDSEIITKQEFRIMTTPEEDIPVKASEEGEKKGISKWVWVGLGALAVGAAALALGGGGGGGGGGGATGSIVINGPTP